MEKETSKKKILKIKEKITGSHEGDQEFIPKKVKKNEKNAISVLLNADCKSNNSWLHKGS